MSGTAAVAAHAVVKEQAVARDLVRPPAGQDIEAGHRHAVGREAFADYAEKPFAQRFGDPAQDPVTDDVVEEAIGGRQCVKAAGGEVDVCQARPDDARHPASIWTDETSMPTKRASGHAAARGMRCPPEAQPISSTRAVATGGALQPNQSAEPAIRAG